MPQKMTEQTVSTTCPYCGIGCGVVASHDGSRVSIAGDNAHPANHGRLCSKGTALADTMRAEGRLLNPEINGQPVPWRRALTFIAKAFNGIINQYGPDAIAMYGSGQLLTEDYYAANKFMKAAIGTANIDTNSRLCMASAVAGHKRAFGEDIVPCDYEDLEQADLVVLVGSNLAWCHPVLHRRIMTARQKRGGPIVIVIDPRRTATVTDADLHLPILPGSDSVLFNGLLCHLADHNALDADFIARHTEGFDAALKAASDMAGDIGTVARACGLSSQLVTIFYTLFTRCLKVVTVFSQGINQSSTGTDNVNSIINVHLASGRIGKPGCGPFSITGQPNAMGGREVGALANQLAAHMDFAEPEIDKVRRFWNTNSLPTKPGLKAVDMFDAIAVGQVKAVWILGTNPVASMPDAGRVAAALKRCGLVVISDCHRHTDTAAFGNVLLPALGWSEKSGTVTNSQRTISRQRAFVDPPPNARADWWIISQVARLMGYDDLFPYQCEADIFREHAALSGFENNGERAFDISYLANLSNREYDALIPLQWPCPSKSPDKNHPRRVFDDGYFYTANRRARLVPVIPKGSAIATDQAYPLKLNTGRTRDQWHTMTRTGVPRLLDHDKEPALKIHPLDACQFQVTQGDFVNLISRQGECLLPVMISNEVQPGSVFASIHWNSQFSTSGPIGNLVNACVDPVSGQPELKHTPVRITPAKLNWSAVILTRNKIMPKRRIAPYQLTVPSRNCHVIRLAAENEPDNYSAWVRQFKDSECQSLELNDKQADVHRLVQINLGQLQTVIYVGDKQTLQAVHWIDDLFAKDSLSSSDQQRLLSAQAIDPSGQIVCACFRVDRNTLQKGISEDRLETTQAIGKNLRAGTNCGSCLPELKKMIEDCHLAS